MKANKIAFLSAPISVSWSTVQEFRSNLLKAYQTVRVWERDSRYVQAAFDKSDVVVFILPKNKFKAEHNELPIGLQSELSRAYAMNKEIRIGYITSSGEYNIYEATTNGTYIHGIPGTARTWEKMIVNSTYGAYADTTFNSNPCAEVALPKAQKVYAKTVPNPDYFDERLILML